MRRYGLQVAVACVSALALGACSDDDSTTPRAVEPALVQGEFTEAALFERGPLSIGHIQTSVSYDAPGVDEPRELPLRIWYPAVEGSSTELADYEVGGLIDLGASEVYQDATPLAGEAFPLVFYSHGSGGDSLVPYPTAELFASRGWIVISPDHVGNTVVDGLMNTLLPLAQVAVLRLTDVGALLDAAADGFGVDELVGRVSTDDVFMYGHSFGGYTSLALAGGKLVYDDLSETACEDPDSEDCAYISHPEVEAAIRGGFMDERVDAFSAQAPALVEIPQVGGADNITIPMLLMSADNDLTTPDEDNATPLFADIENPDDIWLRFADSGHFTFITICHDLEPGLVAAIQSGAVNDGCGETQFPTLEANPLIDAYLVAFAERHVLGGTIWDAILDGPSLDDLDRIDIVRH